MTKRKKKILFWVGLSTTLFFIFKKTGNSILNNMMYASELVRSRIRQLTIWQLEIAFTITNNNPTPLPLASFTGDVAYKNTRLFSIQNNEGMIIAANGSTNVTILAEKSILVLAQDILTLIQNGIDDFGLGSNVTILEISNFIRSIISGQLPEEIKMSLVLNISDYQVPLTIDL